MDVLAVWARRRGFGEYDKEMAIQTSQGDHVTVSIPCRRGALLLHLIGASVIVGESRDVEL